MPNIYSPIASVQPIMPWTLSALDKLESKFWLLTNLFGQILEFLKQFISWEKIQGRFKNQHGLYSC
jgi:hypothetical protein